MSFHGNFPYFYLVNLQIGFIMENFENDNQFVENLINQVLGKKSLSELLESKMRKLDLTETDLIEILGTNSRTLKGFLQGNKTLINSELLIGLAIFLDLPVEEVFKLYISEFEVNSNEGKVDEETITFLKEKFDLSGLKKAGLINSITDYAGLEQKIKKIFNLSSIFDYTRIEYTPAFSKGLVEPKRLDNRALWIDYAYTFFKNTENPHEYNREKLMKLFRTIRSESQDVKNGFINVIRELWYCGVTAVLVPSLPFVQLRGASFAVNGKPCIAISKFRGYYATLWFSMIHELYHVLFDFDKLLEGNHLLNEYMNYDENLKRYTEDADEFAVKYLIPSEKMAVLRSIIKNHEDVLEFSKDLGIHFSIPYIIHAFRSAKENRNIWAKVHKYDPTTSFIESQFFEEAEVLPEISSLKRRYLYKIVNYKYE